MSYIPDCRTDEYYNQRYLNKEDAECVMGYDSCAEDASTFFDNLDMYREEIDEANDGDIELVHYLERHPQIIEILKECFVDYLEMNRDEMITSMIDSMDEEEFEKAKEDVDNGVREPYIRVIDEETGEYVIPIGENE